MGLVGWLALFLGVWQPAFITGTHRSEPFCGGDNLPLAYKKTGFIRRCMDCQVMLWYLKILEYLYLFYLSGFFLSR